MLIRNIKLKDNIYSCEYSLDKVKFSSFMVSLGEIQRIMKSCESLPAALCVAIKEALK